MLLSSFGKRGFLLVLPFLMQTLPSTMNLGSYMGGRETLLPLLGFCYF